jgi:hypothetical protein
MLIRTRERQWKEPAHRDEYAYSIFLDFTYFSENHQSKIGLVNILSFSFQLRAIWLLSRKELSFLRSCMYPTVWRKVNPLFFFPLAIDHPLTCDAINIFAGSAGSVCLSPTPDLRVWRWLEASPQLVSSRTGYSSYRRLYFINESIIKSYCLNDEIIR